MQGFRERITAGLCAGFSPENKTAQLQAGAKTRSIERPAKRISGFKKLGEATALETRPPAQKLSPPAKPGRRVWVGLPFPAAENVKPSTTSRAALVRKPNAEKNAVNYMLRKAVIGLTREALRAGK